METSDDIDDLYDQMTERNDEIDNAVFECISTLAETELEWDMEVIGESTDALITVLSRHDIRVRHPGVVENEDGTFSISEYDDEPEHNKVLVVNIII